MTDTEVNHEARRRAFRAIDETCPVVESIVNDADIDCGIDHEDAARELGDVQSELECQLGTLSDVIGRLDHAHSYACVDEVPSAILSQVTGPFREALIGAHEQCIVVEAKLTDSGERLATSQASDRRARFAIRQYLTMRRIIAS